METDRRPLIYLASREADYSRVRVLGECLKARFDVTEILSMRSGYAARLAEVIWRFVWRTRKPAEVLVVGFLAQPLLPVLRLFWRGPVVSDAMISLKDTLIDDRKHGESGGWLDRIAGGLDRYLVRTSDLVFCDTQAHIEYFRSDFGPTSACFQRVWVGAPDRAANAPMWRLKESGDRPLKVFFYGSFIPLQGTDIIMRAAGLVKSTEAEFRIAGEGPLFNQAKGLADSMEHVRFLGWQTGEQLIEEMLSADLCLGVFGASEKAGRVIPNKAYSAIQVGAPLLTGDCRGIRELLEPGKSVLVCPMDDPEGLANRIRWCAEHREKLVQVGMAGRSAFEQNATKEILTDIVEESITRLLDGP